MASYVVINIDTTSPNIEIYAPSYTTTDILNEIVISADEELSLDYQEIYAIDSNGVRYDYNFRLDTDKYIGNVKFSNMSIGGIITVYAQVMDSVGNKSNIVSKSIHIADSITLLSLEINDRPLMKIEANDKNMNVKVSDKKLNVEINDKSRSVETNDRTMNIESSDRSEKIDNK